jgi:hypothetical protein
VGVVLRFHQAALVEAARPRARVTKVSFMLRS